MINIYQKIHWSSSKVKIVATGETLKDACLTWEANRTNNDDLERAFKKSKYFNRITDKEDDIEWTNEYYNFIDSLTGEQMFEIMRDGQYNYYEEENEDE